MYQRAQLLLAYLVCQGTSSVLIFTETFKPFKYINFYQHWLWIMHRCGTVGDHSQLELLCTPQWLQSGSLSGQVDVWMADHWVFSPWRQKCSLTDSRVCGNFVLHHGSVSSWFTEKSSTVKASVSARSCLLILILLF